MPWDHVRSSYDTCPERAKQNSVFHGRLRRRDSREFWQRPQGTRFLGIAVPRALPWAGKCCFPFQGGIRNRATSKKRGGRGSAISRSFRRRASRHIQTRRAISSDVAPFGSSPQRGSHKSAQGKRPGTTPSSHAPALKGRNRMRFFTCDCDIATAETCGRPYRGACASSESRFPGRCRWAEMLLSPSGRNSRSRITSKRGVEGITISRSFRTRGSRIRPDRASSDVAARIGSSPQRGSHKSAQGNALEDHAQQPRPCPERAKQNAAFHVRLRRRDSRDLWRASSGRCASLESRFRKALPWAEMLFPLRGGIPGSRNYRYAASRGLPFPVPSARAGPTPTGRIKVLMFVRLWVVAPKGQSQISAQGNALGPRQAATSLP